MRYNSIQTAGGRFRPAPATALSTTIPASVGGINSLDSLAGMSPSDCLYTYNLMPSEYGMRLRRGYREWANGMTGGSVNTIIAYEGQSDTVASRRLWAVTADGIWNVTTYGETDPVNEVPGTGPPSAPVPPTVGTAWTNTTGGAGFGNWTEIVNDADDPYLFYADNENGLFRYNGALDIWEIPDFNGTVAAADIAYVKVWKERLWMVERNSGRAWYLEPSAIAGDATPFNFGTKFQHGGELKSLYNWTIDGGNGVDDILVAISQGGDILGYTGTDPETVDGFGLIASYYVGEFPRSRNVGLEYGGELYLLSTYGVISVRQLLQGVIYQDPSVGPSAKINRFRRDAVDAGSDSFVWSMSMYPRDGFIQIVAPYNESNRNNAIQYLQNTITQAWGMWRGVPAYCGSAWNKLYLMGTPDGTVIEHFGGIDNSKLDPAEPQGVAIEYSTLTSYQPPLGDSTSYKRVGFVRPIQIANVGTNTNVGIFYDYEVDPILAPPPSGTTGDSSLWDVAKWDAAKWDSAAVSDDFVLGTLGEGRVVAVAMRGSSTERLTFIGWDINFTVGGFL